MAEQLICNQQVVGSSPSASSLSSQSMIISAAFVRDRTAKCDFPTPGGIPKSWGQGGFPERSKGSDCKSDGNAFAGSNPAPPISLPERANRVRGCKVTNDSLQDGTIQGHRASCGNAHGGHLVGVTKERLDSTHHAGVAQR